jgi:Mg2+-importing ATPase
LVPDPTADAGGLTTEEAARRLSEYGPNEPVVSQRLSALSQFLHLFANPLVIILLVASVISIALGQGVDAGIIVSMILLGVAINFWQSYRSDQAAERLRASVTPTATARRDGRWQEVPIRSVVPGDVVRLSAGDLVPADARLIDSRDLSVQQSMLTGESLPCDKHASPAGQSGSAEAHTLDGGPEASHLVFLGTSVVSGTGTALVLATGPKTEFGEIARRLGARPSETEFERGLRRFSLLILRTTIALVLFILLVGIILKHNPLESLLFAVALGVGLTPEFLPMIAAVTLTRGALRMAREQVIVKHLPAIQNFGSIDILCSDKTGTLTAGAMRLEAVLDPKGAPSSRALVLGYLNSRFETGIRSPLDTAILDHKTAATDDDKKAAETDGYKKIDEIPFDFERRRLSVVVEPVGDARRHLLITKGAPESILPLATDLEMEGQIVPIDASARQTCETVQDRLSREGLRVLAVGYRWVEPRAAFSRADETGLVLAGYLAFADPLLPDAADAIAELGRDGVTVKILTGDNELVARHVSRSIGLDDSRIVTGDDLARLDDAALGHVAEQASVFTRVSPAQKNRILLALKRRGHVVGYIGDGINDAPSLHTADVGISVMSATDVARDAAAVILGRPGLGVLHRGILEGRRASGNMMKYLLMGTSSNFGNMFSMAAASVFLPFLPMLPTQILLNNFLYDLAQITIPGDNVDREHLARPQRWDLKVVRDFMIFIGPISSCYDFLTFYVLLHYFHAGERLFHTGWFVESLATQTLVLFVIRTMGNPLRSHPSGALSVTTLGVVALGAILPATPLGPLLAFTVPPVSFLIFVVTATTTYLVFVELAKRALIRYRGISA